MLDTPFPFGFPLSTAFYLVFYVLTLTLHWVFMHYVLAGNAYTVVRRSIGSMENEPNSIDAFLRDWMPLMLSGAITAGIAPLLFVQILYQHEFYSANALLFHRWMAILPTLIAGFYLLYLIKTERFLRWPVLVRLAVTLGSFCCFLFIAWSWTENHLLSLDRGLWPDQYASGHLTYRNEELIPRLLMWFAISFPSMATLVGWQIWGHSDAENEIARHVRRATVVALGGLLASLLTTVGYAFSLSEERRELLTSGFSLPYVILIGIGFALQALVWIRQWGQSRFEAKWLSIASTGGVLMLLGLAVVRESLRIGEIAVEELFPRHERAYQTDGFTLFLVFLTICLALIGFSIWLVRKGLQERDHDSITSESSE